MKAIRVHETGGPEALRYDEIATPVPAEGEVRVKLAAVGLNFIDIYHRRGLYPKPPPFIPGLEGAGVVDALGAGVSNLAIGDRVAFTMQPNSYAEYVNVPAWKLVPVPAGVTLEQAAAVMLQGTTAHYLTTDTFPLKSGDTALVHAAAGGVGLFLVQMAKMREARVIGTVSTEEKAQLARNAGADDIIFYTKSDFETETMALTDGAGVEVVYDSVGATTFEKGFNCLKPRGYMVLYGQSSGPVGSIDPQVLNAKGSIFLTRPSLGHYVANREDLLSRTNDIFGWIAENKLQVRIDQSFLLAEAADAHRYIEARKTKGKVLLIP